MKWPYPGEGVDPWYDAFESMVRAQDGSVLALNDAKNIILSGGGTISWNAGTGVVAWTLPIQLNSALSGFIETIPAGSLYVPNDGDYGYVRFVPSPQQNVELVIRAADVLPGSDVDRVFALFRRRQNKLYWRNGGVLSSGESAAIIDDGPGGGSGGGSLEIEVNGTPVGPATTLNFNSPIVISGSMSGSTATVDLQLASSVKVVTTTPYNFESTYRTFYVNVGAAAAFNLPPAENYANQLVTVKTLTSNGLIVYPNGSETIDGYDGLELENQHESVTLQSASSDGGATWNWFMIAKLCGGGGGGGGIGGTIDDIQIAYGTGSNTIGGSSNLTWNYGTNILTLGDGSSNLTTQPSIIDSDAGTLQLGGAAQISIGGTFLLPTDAGGPGEVLTSDGAGGTSWEPSSSSPAGDDGQIQFNSVGAFGADINLSWNGASERLFTPTLGLPGRTTPLPTLSGGVLWANSDADARPYWLDGNGQSYNLTLDRYTPLSYVGATSTVEIDVDPSKPVFNSIALTKNTTFTTANLGDGRSASVRVVCDGTTRTLTFPAWKWLGSGAPPSLAAGKVGYLSLTAYGASDTDVVAAWSYEDMPVAVTGSGTDNQIAVWSGTYTQDGSSTLTFNSSTNAMRLDGSFGINGAPTTALDLVSGQLAIPRGSATAPAIALRANLDSGFFAPTVPFGTTVITNEAVDISLNNSDSAGFRDLSAGAITATQLFVGVNATDFGVLTLGQRTVGSDAISLTSAMIEGHINDTVTGSGAGAALYTYGNTGVASGFIVRRARGVQAGPPSAVQSGDLLGTYNGSGFDGTAFTAAPGQSPGVRFFAAENFTGTNAGAKIEFWTVPTGSKTPASRVVVAADGNVGIDAPIPTARLSVAEKFKVDSNGNITRLNDVPTSFPATQGSVGSFLVNTDGAGALQWVPPIDYRLVTLDTTTSAVGNAVAFNGDLDVTNASGMSFALAKMAGIVKVVGPHGTGQVQVIGIATGAKFVSDLTLTAGDRVFLSSSPGLLTNEITDQDIQAEVGLVADASLYATTQTASVLIQYKPLIFLGG